MFLDEINKQKIVEFINMRYSNGIKDKTINNDLGVLSVMFNFAIEHDLININPVSTLSKRIKRRLSKKTQDKFT